MGHFDKSICDCCVCPMQCVLEQLAGQTIDFVTTVSSGTTNLISVDNFIAFTSIGNIPICQFTGVAFNPALIPGGLKLKLISKNKGECACCEDPITNLLISLKGQFVEIEFIKGSVGAIVNDIGEGIIILRAPEPTSPILAAISSCSVTKITPMNQQQFSQMSSSSNPNHLLSPPAT
ncbi:hypothetical protein [Chengkuizengella sediminis]|uniref:hypothetical protein n=1 Tax=Chengkuizengella sediminis TaxID=1885917 RepID=UPI0013894578|nr:hypothetical protein [Chengkuizengella sediminis]NDI34649.1 hypothetical protein [Chengkuizengella sediminis]